jgi:hypothetical protein
MIVIVAVRLARSTVPSLAFGGQVPISVHDPKAKDERICTEGEKKPKEAREGD